MSLYEFQRVNCIGNQTIAESDARLSESQNYALWIEDSHYSREKEIHICRVDKDFIPQDDRILIRTLEEQTVSSEIFVGNDGHAYLSVKEWTTPEGNTVGPEGILQRLLKVF